MKGIQKKLIQNDNPKVMLVYIPQSDESPHQSGDNKYYIRLDSESKPVPHYLVELHFGKRSRPKLTIQIDKIKKPQLSLFKNEWSPICPLNLKVLNSGKAIAKHVSALFFFRTNLVQAISPYSGVVNKLMGLYPEIKDISVLYPKGTIVWQFKDNQEVIHPETLKNIWEGSFKFYRSLFLEPDTEENDPILEWKFYAEGMEIQTGKVILSSLFQ